MNAARGVLLGIAVCVAAVVPTAAADPGIDPGLYRIEVRISLPHVQDTGPPAVVDRCLTAQDIAAGRAFAVLSDNPLQRCEIRDYAMAGGVATFRIACPGPNRGAAEARFEADGGRFHGRIVMNMGGKNMTMDEAQTGVRVGACP